MLAKVPPALQVGRQGLPTIGVKSRPEPISRYSTASVPDTIAVPSRPVPPGPQKKPPSAATPAGAPAHSTSAKASFKVAFEFGSARLKPEAVETLRNLGKALNEDLSDQNLFQIEGHTDAVGSSAYNEELSRLRAEAVKEFLVRTMGVAPERLAAVGKGFREPLNPRNPKGAENRRVVVVNQTS